MRWASSSFAVQDCPGSAVSLRVRSSYADKTRSSSARADRMSARKSALLTPSLARDRGAGSGERGLELREVGVDGPGVAHHPHHRPEQRVVDLSALGDREAGGLVPVGRDLEGPGAAERALAND